MCGFSCAGQVRRCWFFRTGRRVIGWGGGLFAEMYALNDNIVWGTRDSLRFLAILLTAADCRRGMLGPNSEISWDECRVLNLLWEVSDLEDICG